MLFRSGAEALYADMGHFGPKPIRIAWMGIVFPSLVLNTGQSTAAMAIGNFQPPPSVSSINVTNMQFAAYTIVSVPLILLFIIFLRYFISGMASGAVKM